MIRARTPAGRALTLFLLALPIAVQAQVLQSVTGDVRIGAAEATQDQRVPLGSIVATGAKAQAILSFEDGQRVVLHENTQFRVVDFQYRPNDAKADRSVFDILRGAARIVTGALAQRSRSAFSLRAPQATIGVRGTDFMVAIVNPLYVSVISGTISATSAAGSVVFAAGSIGTVSSSTALASTIPASALPAGVSSTFSSLSSVAVSAAGATTAAGGAGAGGATGAAFGGLAPAIAAGAAAAGIAAGALNTGSPAATTGTTGTR